MIIKRISNGAMNMDGNKRLLPQGDYPFANNICKEATSSGYDGTPNATPGNYLATSLTGDSSRVDTVIYAHADQYRKKVYYFIYNASGYHQIRVWDKDTNTITLLIEDKTNTNGVSILNFSLTYPVTSCDIIHRDSSEGDLMFFTDGYNPPRKVNISKLTSGYYGSYIKEEYITLAKTPPLSTPSVSFGSDSSRNTNNLKKKVYQLKYRWIYDDFEKSTWSPMSTVVLPVDANTDNDIYPNFNNYINTVVTTGSKIVKKIEIAARESVNDAWLDFFTVDILDKSALSILDNTSYSYRFYNDGMYPPVNVQESDLTFDYVPKKAKAQCLVNGNVLLYGCITEGYNNLGKSNLSVTMQTSLVSNNASDTSSENLPGLTYTNVGSGIWNIVVSSNLVTGTVYRVAMTTDGLDMVVFEYTSLSTDTATTIANGLYLSCPVAYRYNYYYALASFDVQLTTSGSILYVQAITGSSAGTISTASSWNWFSKYRFGLIYFDEKGRTNGVETFITSGVSSSNDFEINTPNFTHTSNVPNTPVIDATISHTPPSWAVKYMWVRTQNLTYDRFIYYISADFYDDGTFYYFCLSNIDYYAAKNSNFIYDSAGISEGDRLKVICNASSGGYGSNYYYHDYEILGVVEMGLTYAGSSNQKANFVKVKKPITPPTTPYSLNMFVMVYTPGSRSSSATDNVFYEFGDSYDIYTDNLGVKRHRGMITDQTSSVAASFKWTTGDTYYHYRKILTKILDTDNVYTNVRIMDVNYSDYFKSAVSGNGRPQIVDDNAKEQFYPTLVRFSQEYVADSNINGTNRFYYDNQDIYNRSFGEIVKLIERDKTIRVFQQFKVGTVPVYQQIIKDAIGSDTVSVSDKLLNYIQYYQGDYGAGYHGTAIASNEFADYFVDAYRGVICRLGRDGITPLSSIYKVNNWATDNLTVRNSPTQKIVGCFDKKLQRYVMSFKAAYPYGEDTISFHEPSNSFESFHDFTPDFMVNLGSTFISFVGNGIWIHENETSYCNFYGVQYNPSISVVFNDLPDVKKTFTNVSVVTSGNAWYCTGVATPIGQFSAVPTSLFRKKEDVYHAPLLRDVYSTGSYISGNRLKGNYIEINFRPSSSSTFNNLTMSMVSFIESNKNNR